jgi:putative oxidoreductase
VSSNPVFLFFATRANLGPLVLRLALATIFFYHGSREVFGWFGGEGWHATIAHWTQVSGLSLSYLTAAFVMIAKIVIAVGLFFGFLTRLVAFAVVLFMSASLIFLYTYTTFDVIEMPVLLLCSGLALVFLGGGLLSIDRAIGTNLLPHVG